MKRWKFSSFFLIFLWIFLGLLSRKIHFPIPSKPNPNFENPFYDFSGTIHFHTIYSDGSGTVQEIMQAAKKSNLDFLVVTDHQKESREKVTEGKYHNRSADFQLVSSQVSSKKNIEDDSKTLFLLSGSEIGTDFGHHLELGGLKIMAHPFHPLIPRKDMDRPNHFDGLEIINASSLAHESLVKVFPVIGSLLIYPFNSNYSFFSTYKNPVRELKLWDRLNQEDKLKIGIVATDAHANIVLWDKMRWRIRFPSYETLFKIMKMHLLTKEGIRDKEFSKVKETFYRCLKEGRYYFSVDLFLDPDGFLFQIRSENSVVTGENLRRKKNRKYFADVRLGRRIPLVPKEIRLLKDGKIIATTHGEILQLELEETGTYRAEVYLTIKTIFGSRKKVLWIGSSAITVSK